MTAEEEARLVAIIEREGGEVTDKPTGVAFILVIRRVHVEGPIPLHAREGKCDRCAEPVIVSLFSLKSAPAAELICTACLKADEVCDGVLVRPVDLAARLEAEALTEKKAGS